MGQIKIILVLDLNRSQITCILFMDCRFFALLLYIICYPKEQRGGVVGGNSEKIYVWILIRSASPRSFWWVPTSYFIAPACSRVRYRHPIFRQSVRPSIRLSTFMSTFDIYVKVSILINYKTKQPSNLAWNISLTSWLCNIGVRFSVCLSVCQHLCRSSTFMSKLVF